jgi:hypothetical protein
MMKLEQKTEGRSRRVEIPAPSAPCECCSWSRDQFALHVDDIP